MHSVVLESALVIVGVLAGVGARRRLSGCRDRLDDADPEPSLVDMDPLIRDVALRWAAARKRPEAAGIMADKLRTLYRIKYERSVERPRRWWSR